MLSVSMRKNAAIHSGDQQDPNTRISKMGENAREKKQYIFTLNLFQSF